MSTLDHPPAPADRRRPAVPLVTLPVLVCLPTTSDAPPADRAALAAMIGLAVIGNGPSNARYRVGGRYAGLLRHTPHPPAVASPILISSEASQWPPVCDGGTLAWLDTIPARLGDGDLVRVVTPEGRWYGPVPWHPGPPPTPPPPVAYLRLLLASTVVVLTELAVPLASGECTVPPWEWPS